ncbi:2-amino-4-hydroxy-6-hydroxymethyldihydropteridine diphosphokinase [Arcicella aquatica]|uniref:2-amino-4-hydroxy-6-hydroxymethyldihydropteridine pyrophosphokinase n=1 Tax=Arcicella aquatica TaxID=217141 RepID=A0ABU5QHB9_9BACT|nr:2-amino-4-hydroxy-6-hydroxymethyldihydropteridine diphosphokinase [Arcicella aquatica]MEA5256452.1 2-amino-4-hydroxy-6-hydroxymethyldihydropteridine diphosphokinase [Arcicella aquatica]
MQNLNLQTTYLLLGSNLGNREEILENAIKLIGNRVGLVLKRSKFYETAPWGVDNQPNYLNIAIAVTTTLNPNELLIETQQIEETLGRIRLEKWGARLIDIDIIFYGEQIINEPTLVIPHPLMHDRNFVLVPLEEIAPDFIHPIFHKSITTLCNLCADIGEVKPYL